MQKHDVEVVDMEKYELKNPEIRMGKALGSGMFATVRRADYQIHGEKKSVAIKIMHPKEYADENFEIEVQNNIFLSEANVKNIVKFYGFFSNEFQYWMMFELVHCTLAQKIRPSICGLHLISKEDAIKGKFLNYDSYFLLKNFEESSFFYSDHKNKTMKTIAIISEQYIELKQIYRDKYDETSLLLSDQIAEIEKITGHILEKKDGLSHQQLRHILWQLGCVFKYFEEIGFVYADLKPDNIGLTEHDKLKLLDFGTAFPLADPLDGPLGNLYYLAPEGLQMVQDKISGPGGNTLASDRYAYALMLYCALVSRDEFPYNWLFDWDSHYFYVVTERRRPPFPDHFNDPLLQAIIQKGWSHNPADRPTAAAMLEMLEQWIESKDIGCKSSDSIVGYSQTSSRNLFFKPIPLVEDSVVSDYSPELWK